MIADTNEQNLGHEPSFGVAFFVVLAAGLVGAMIASPLARFFPIRAGAANQYLLTWTLLTSVFAASTARVLLRLLSYKVMYASALAAFVAGAIADTVLLNFFTVRIAVRTVPLMPSGGISSSLALVAEVLGLLVTTWIIQYGASGHPLRRPRGIRAES